MSVTFTFEGHRPPLTLNALKKMSVPFPKPFSHLSENCRPIADKPRKYSQADLHFIRDETRRLLSDDLIEPSNSLRGELKYSLSWSSQENVAWPSITAELLTASLSSTPTPYLASIKLLMSLLNIGFSQLLI